MDGRITGVTGRIIDVNILAWNYRVYAIGVESRVKLEHVEALPDRARAVERLLNRPVARRLFAAVNVDGEALESIQELSIEAIAESVLD